MEKSLLLKRIWVLILLSSWIGQQSIAQDSAAARLFGGETVSPISVAVSGKLALCSHSEKGSIILDVTGGKAPYTFKWNTNETTQNRSNLFAGTYTVNITDADGVVHVERIVVQPPYPLILNPLEKRDASCGSGADGYAKIGVKVGRGEPYRISWSHGLEDQWEASNLKPGSYTVTVTDMFNCDVSISFEIESETEGMSLSESIKQPDCSSAGSGEINLNVTGGSAPYLYSWSHGPSTANVSGLAPGDYSVMITDKTGCSIQANYSLQAPSAIEVSASVDDPTCGDQNDGSISLDIQGGQAPYTVSWSTGQSGSSLSNLGAGTYQASITDAQGCTVQQTVSLNQSSGIDLRIQEIQPVSCFGGNDGTASIEIEGDKKGLNILWSDGVEDVLKRTDLAPGTYTVTATNHSGCEMTQSLTVESPNELTARIESALDVDCAVGSIQGVAWVSIQGGTEPYTIAWGQSGASNREINFSQTTTLQVTITDAKGCVVSAESKVDFPSNTTSGGRLDFNFRKLAITSEPEVQVDEEIIFESEISEEFIAWEWSFGDGNQSVDKDPIHIFEKAGIYEVTLTGYDIYGCSSVEINTVQVNIPQEMVVIPNAFTPNGDGLNDTFMPKLKSVTDFSMQIFNTWGERMFTTTQKEDKGWDGIYNGQLLPAGNYLYNITYSTPEGEIIHRTGGVTLIR
ncbi:gliding motility-associated C-terminal domain-containing protein [Algoriphagus namhaensis]|uniref:Gliding motility-associated C-terminal domain-containing protein n=1 Tax=Algoriphagus namhaensis TaxID=915353 RepID=A0ABV8ANY7_9BACT